MQKKKGFLFWSRQLSLKAIKCFTVPGDAQHILTRSNFIWTSSLEDLSSVAKTCMRIVTFKVMDNKISRPQLSCIIHSDTRQDRDWWCFFLQIKANYFYSIRIFFLLQILHFHPYTFFLDKFLFGFFFTKYLYYFYRI